MRPRLVLLGWTALPERTTADLGTISRNGKMKVVKRLRGRKASLYLAEHNDEVEAIMRLERRRVEATLRLERKRKGES